MIYEFENIVNGEIGLFSFPIKNAPSLGSIVKIKGVKFKRVITRAPCGIVKGSENPMSSHAFVEKTGKQKGTMGDLFDQSRELSEKRKKMSKDGRDPIQDKYFDNWSAKRAGKQNPADDRPKPKTTLKIKK